MTSAGSGPDEPPGHAGATARLTEPPAPGPGRLYRLIALASWPIVTRLFRLDVRGAEHVPARGAFVVAANHASNLDPWPLAIALWPRPLHFMVKHEAWWPPLKWLLAAVGTFPVRREEGDIAALLTATELCRGGHVMAMFPEGTRRTKGLRKKRRPRLHSGAAFVALQAGVPLVPAAIGGMDRLTRLGPARVLFGPAIPLDDLKGLGVHPAADEATRRLWIEVQRLEGELDPRVGPGPGVAHPGPGAGAHVAK